MISEEIEAINNTIAGIVAKERITHPVRLMAVSKTYPAEKIKEAVDAGQLLFGENRVLEAKEKFTSPALGDKNLELHIIGHLQRNKAKQAVEIASCIQSIDKVQTLEAIEKHCLNLDRSIDYLIEVNTSNEPEKHGVAPEELEKLLEAIESKHFSRCNLRGLMTVGPLTGDTARIRASFRHLRTLFTTLKDSLKKGDFDTVSMGMSSDFTIAVEEGSTLVRVGSKIFGSRNYG